jgi:Na+-transporting methylmalonyl-CoA/oxaloacetate decarboxylase gamma subunit
MVMYDLLQNGLIVSVAGMLTVFVVLLFLLVTIYIFRWWDNRLDDTGKREVNINASSKDQDSDTKSNVESTRKLDQYSSLAKDFKLGNDKVAAIALSIFLKNRTQLPKNTTNKIESRNDDLWTTHGRQRSLNQGYSQQIWRNLQ